MAVNSIIRTDFDTSDNQDLSKNLLRDIWDSTDDREADVQWKDLCLNIKVTDEYEREMRMAGFDYPGLLGEGENIPIDSPKYGSTKDWTQQTMGSGFRITHRMDKFNKYKLTFKWTKNLKLMQSVGKDVEIAKMFNNPTATTYAAGYDGFALGYASHTCLDDAATTYDNILSSALSMSALESALAYFDYMYNDSAHIITAKPTHLVHAAQLKVTAHELLQTGLKPHELSNTNTQVGTLYGIKPYTYIRLTSSTAWFVIAKDDPLYDIKVFTSMEPDLVEKDAPDNTRDTIYTSLQYFTYGYGDPRMYFLGNT